MLIILAMFCANLIFEKNLVPEIQADLLSASQIAGFLK